MTDSLSNRYVVIFLSYDEPNADQNFMVSQPIVGNLLRVHGIKGFDSAHKACAALAREHGATHFLPSTETTSCTLVLGVRLNKSVVST